MTVHYTLTPSRKIQNRFAMRCIKGHILCEMQHPRQNNLILLLKARKSNSQFPAENCISKVLASHTGTGRRLHITREVGGGWGRGSDGLGAQDRKRFHGQWQLVRVPLQKFYLICMGNQGCLSTDLDTIGTVTSSRKQPYILERLCVPFYLVEQL